MNRKGWFFSVLLGATYLPYFPIFLNIKSSAAFCSSSTVVLPCHIFLQGHGWWGSK
ncbi:hypothetical protein Taro_008474 [Colocasia esculenta]|uniref:Uncharacterized protein n=1 Tax=Colocasia esculenta TaxID=4460 RepID=A0A843U2G2_COLES|nr:hypothetical protein [Colocasia esculenta]